MILTDSLAFMPLQYIRIVPRELSPDAALAEVEAVAIGRNIAPGTPMRGGSIRSAFLGGQSGQFADFPLDMRFVEFE